MMFRIGDELYHVAHGILMAKQDRRIDTSHTDVLPTSEWKRTFRRRLIGWYRRHAREMPWRETRDPYRVWVSEIMLQQTQVATVVPYFERFIAAFPDIPALAAAREDEVLRLWEGLGYYRRARQMHKAAGVMVEKHDGRFPRDANSAGQLPGVGRYTLGAILSIAFDARQPILEANTVRLLSRLLAFDGDPTRADAQRLLWAMAEALLPRREAGRFNQALMELGSQICLPRGPRCEDCPAMALCPTRAAGRQEEIPRTKKKPPPEEVREAAVVVRRRGKVLLLRRDNAGRWAGLWDFPRFELSSRRADAVQRELVEKVRQMTGFSVQPEAKLTTIKHSVTRFRITLECHEARYLRQDTKPQNRPEMRWLLPEELEAFPLSVSGRKLGCLLVEDSDSGAPVSGSAKRPSAKT